MAHSLTDIYLPKRLAFCATADGGAIEQVIDPAKTVSGEYHVHGRAGDRYGILLTTSGERYCISSGTIPLGEDSRNVLLAPDTLLSKPSRLFGPDSAARWLSPDPNTASVPDPQALLAALAQGFSFREEDRTSDRAGLRTPQIGALHAILAHWSISLDLATVVMPTGSGKTETMLALFAHCAIPKLLVLVPSVALREQTVAKFQTMGLLRSIGVIDSSAPNPVVATILHSMHDPAAVEALFEPAQVVVGLMQTVAESSPEALRRMADLTTTLVIDEAHHVAAPTWSAVRAAFLHRPILQFTATPYRRDRKRVDGRIIYNYPLHKAQSEDLFRPIRYLPVFEFVPEKGDEAIAQKAVETLEQDLLDGHDHLVMARCNEIERAKQLHDLYVRLAPQFNPVVVYSKGMSAKRRREAITAVRSRSSRIIVCVDMLGEGFDLPQLKIAAIHDVHKSLAITLQFTGRFTRSTQGVGDAAMIVNAGDVKVDSALRDLYADDADWNTVIQRIGERALGRRQSQSDFHHSFDQLQGQIPLQNLVPNMSTVVFRVTCDTWAPDEIVSLISPDRLYWGPAVSDEHKVAVFVTRESEDVPWGDIRELRNTAWHLYLLYWDLEAGLLYINSSDNSGLHDDIAKQVCGEDAEIISGETVYRALHDVRRLTLMNLGLSLATGRAIRHEMLNGTDVVEALRPGQLGTRRKTNLFGRGYQNGERCSIGCSSKGRIWSHSDAEDISAWVEWCQGIGGKLLDSSITSEQILQGILKPEPVTARPHLVPLAMDWNHRMYLRSEEAVTVRLGDKYYPFYETELAIRDFKATGPIPFELRFDDQSVSYEAVFEPSGLSFRSTGPEEAVVCLGRREVPLTDLFRSEPPEILFEGDNYIQDNLFISISRDQINVFDRHQMLAWDWTGINLRHESQRKEKRESIQKRVIEQLQLDTSWELIFDDDSSGESADIVAVKRAGEFAHVLLVHCKYAASGGPAALVDDLYEVCGQAQKCIRWRQSWEDFFAHLRRRERRRLRKSEPSRIEKGNERLLVELLNQSRLLRPRFEVYIVQPGLSKANATTEQLTLLGATEMFLADTWAIPLTVVSSA